jgi:hypothetical protein
MSNGDPTARARSAGAIMASSRTAHELHSQRRPAARIAHLVERWFCTIVGSQSNRRAIFGYCT